VALSGTYGGSPPTSIEHQLYAEDGVTVLRAWTAIPGATIGGGTWSGSASIPRGGPYRIAYRRNDGAVSSVKSNLFLVGGFHLSFGSSSAARMYTSESGTGFTPAANVRKYKGSFAKFGTDGCAIQYANSLAAQSGAPVCMMDYGVGGTLLADWLNTSGPQWTALAAGVAAVGGKLEAAYLTVGSNDAATSTVASRAAHLANLRQLIANLRALTGQPNLPVLLSGMNRRINQSVGAATLAIQANHVRMAESDLGDDENVCHVQTLDLLLSGDNIHLSSAGAGFPASATRAAYVLGRKLYGDGVYHRGPKIAAINAQGSAITAALTHRGGSDFTPASGITGFTASDASGTLTLSPVVRANATTITMTADRAIVAPLTVQYLAGGAPAVGTPVFDNGATVLPLTAETTLAATVISHVSSDYQLAYAIEPNVALVAADYPISYAVESLLTLVSNDFTFSYSVFNDGSVLDAAAVPAPRVVVFGGGSRVVTFGGGTRMVAFDLPWAGQLKGENMTNAPEPYFKDGKWWVDKDPDEQSFYVANLTKELTDRATTIVSVEAIVEGVEKLTEPDAQDSFVVIKLGGLDVEEGAANFWTCRVTCANGERFDRTMHFNRVDN